MRNGSFTSFIAYGAACEVNAHLTHRDGAQFNLLFSATRYSSYPRKEFFHVKWFGDVVIGGQAGEGQFQMAEAVANALTDRHHFLVQAGTGTGKSLAYLVPSLVHGK